MKRIWILFLLFHAWEVSSQVTTDVQFAFKMALFLDKGNAHLSGDSTYTSKNEALFQAFVTTMNFNIDTLNSQGFSKEYSFYAIDMSGGNYSKNVIFLKEVTDEELQYLTVFINCTGYIIAICKKEGKVYRLSGFNGNDFLSFLSDIEEGSTYPNFINRIARKTFFRHCKVDGIDFRCLYKSLRAKKMNRNKYPCLRRCSDPVIIH